MNTDIATIRTRWTWRDLYEAHLVADYIDTVIEAQRREAEAQRGRR